MNTVANNAKDKKGTLGSHFADFYRRRLHVTKNNWHVYVWIRQFLGKAMEGLSHPVIGPQLRKFLKSEPGEFNQAYTVPISWNLETKTENTVMPIYIVRKAVEESSYRMIIDKCICRDAEKGCKVNATDIGCIMLGEASRKMVDSGIGRYATVEKTLAHLERGAQMGLVANCGWLAFETEGVLGVNPQDSHRLLEICLCCPCCCLALHQMKNIKSIPSYKDLVKNVGWISGGSTDDCISCGQCIEICPMEAIEFSGEGVSVNEEKCMGCGLCAFKCPEDTIAMKQHEPVKEHILDHFRGFRPRLNG